MNIWLTQIGEQLPLSLDTRKMRTALLADELVQRKHSVVWWASAFDHSSKKFLFDKDKEIFIKKNYSIRILKGKGYCNNVSISRYIDHKIIAEKLYAEICRLQPPDIIVVSMPDHLTAFQAVRYANLKNVPVLVDVRDEWPDIFLTVFPKFLRLTVRRLLKKDFDSTANLLANCQAITSMMESLHQWALNKARRKKRWTDRVYYLGTMPPVDYDVDRISPQVKYLRESTRKRFVLLYIGTFGKHNDPTIMVEAAAEVKKAHKSDYFTFIIAGDGKYHNKIAQKVENFDNVFLPGWVGQNEISFLLSLASVGVIPSTSRRDEFPNKAFTYLSAGIPIVASSGGELKNIVDKFHVGCFYSPNDTTGFVKLINGLVKDPGRLRKMSENAKNLFEERFHAVKIYSQFADHIENIVACQESVSKVR